jgi:hypothetical protein
MPYGASMHGASMHRAPYHSPYGGNHYHYGYPYSYNRVVYVNAGWPWGWGYPYAWGYPYVWPSIFSDWDNYDSPSTPYYPAPQSPGYGVGPYQYQPEEQQAPPEAPENYPQQPNAQSVPYAPGMAAPSGAAQAVAPVTPVTLVFKDGRAPEQVYNYMMTARTLTVFDQPSRNIPLDQIDLAATARVNLQAGVEFSVPGRSH